jgi:competence protein ComGC
MKLFESRKEKFFKTVLLLFPLFLLLCIGLIFFIAIGRTSDATIQKEQSALLQTLENGAVRTYALKGQYPESLDELLSDYHIIYDSSRFVIEYVPNGSNLLPSISVIPLTGTNFERRNTAL